MSCLAVFVIVYFVHVGFLNQTKPSEPEESATTSGMPSPSMSAMTVMYPELKLAMVCLVKVGNVLLQVAPAEPACAPLPAVSGGLPPVPPAALAPPVAVIEPPAPPL